MTVPVKFVLSRRDLVPPVYLAGSFTQWQASLLMDISLRTEGENTWNEFQKTVELEPGVYQYKFRLGEGDWWITDDTHEKVTDDSGNVNNTILVKEPPKVESAEPIKQTKPVEDIQKPEVNKEATKHDDESDDKPSLRWSTRSKKSSDDTTSSSNLTVVETSSLLKNRSTTTHQAETYNSINVQTNGTAPATAKTNGVTPNGLDGARSPAAGDAKGKPESRNIFRKLFCFCSSTTGLSLAGFGTVLVAAYIIHAQVN